VVPLFIAAPASYGIELTAGGKVPLGKGQADAIDLKGPDIGNWRLLLDEKTHLPIKIVWKAKPIVMFSTMMTTTTTTTSTVTTRRGEPPVMPAAPPPPPPVMTMPVGDPSANLDPVDWEMTIGDYKVADGLNWPHRVTTTFDGKKWEDTRIGKYKINPKIDPKKFERRK
jgi:hypothetical protein